MNPLKQGLKLKKTIGMILLVVGSLSMNPLKQGLKLGGWLEHTMGG